VPSTWILVLVATVLGLPPSILLHEFGHALAALRFTNKPVSITVGVPGIGVDVQAGRLWIHFSPFGGSGICHHTLAKQRLQQAAIALAGPFASFVAAVVLYFAAVNLSSAAQTILLTVAAVNAFGLLALVPTTMLSTQNRPSDGLRVLYLLRNRPLPPLTARLQRGGLRRNPTPREVVLTIVASVAGGVIAQAFPLAFAFWLGLAIQSSITGLHARRTQTGAAQPSRSAPH
jgi:hypothetical protein